MTAHALDGVIPITPWAMKALGRWALGGYTSAVLAEHLGIRSTAEARRIRTEKVDPVSVACALTADARGDGARIVQAVGEAFESRWLHEAAAAPRTLRARLGHLVTLQLHEGHSALVRILIDAESGDLQERLRSQAALLTEAAAIRHALGVAR